MKNVAEFVAQSRKACVGLIVAFVVSALASRGVTLPADVNAALTGLVTALSVWLVPNKGA